MSWLVIGAPGGPPRIIITARASVSQGQLQAGEVAVIVDTPGDYVIAADGASVANREKTAAEKMAEVRNVRNALLDATGKYMDLDFPISEEEREAWIAYRQALRDLPEAQPDATLDTVVWPVPPGGS